MVKDKKSKSEAEENPRVTADGKFVAIDDLSFNIRHQETFGLLGPNGSGKTTTIQTLQAMLPPTSGNALISGESVAKPTERLYQLLGVVAQFDRALL
jgi:ABC-type multidrug transport system ATPase subunit